MNVGTEPTSDSPTTPWHLWAVGILALLWNAAGAYTILMAQAGKLANLSADEVAYYAAQPMWLVIATDVALFGAILAAIALLSRRRVAVWMFGISLAAIFVTDVYDLAAGTSRMLANTGALVATIFIFVIAILEVVYARAMKGRRLLR